jgi:hypothetical protein
MKARVLGLALAAAALGATATAETSEMRIAGVRIGNPFDSSTWWDAAEGKHDMHHASVEINFADPAFWLGFVTPEEHSVRHMAFTNPATWAQFMDPRTYANMADVDTLAKWMDPASYAVLTEPQTYAYWAQPGAYMHVMRAENYGQMLEADNYGKLADGALKVFGMTMPGNVGKEMIGPSEE